MRQCLRDLQKKISSCSICGAFRRRALDIAAKSVNADLWLLHTI